MCEEKTAAWLLKHQLSYSCRRSLVLRAQKGLMFPKCIRHAVIGYYTGKTSSRPCQDIFSENPPHHNVFTPSCPGFARVWQLSWKHLTLKGSQDQRVLMHMDTVSRQKKRRGCIVSRACHIDTSLRGRVREQAKHRVSPPRIL